MRQEIRDAQDRFRIVATIASSLDLVEAFLDVDDDERRRAGVERGHAHTRSMMVGVLRHKGLGTATIIERV